MSIVDKSFTVEPLTMADSEEVILFLRTFFFKVRSQSFTIEPSAFTHHFIPSQKDEPLNKSLDLGDCPELEQWTVKYLKENCSFKAINVAGEIIGLVINASSERNVSHTCGHTTNTHTDTIPLPPKTITGRRAHSARSLWAREIQAHPRHDGLHEHTV